MFLETLIWYNMTKFYFRNNKISYFLYRDITELQPRFIHIEQENGQILEVDGEESVNRLLDEIVVVFNGQCITGSYFVSIILANQNILYDDILIVKGTYVIYKSYTSYLYDALSYISMTPVTRGYNVFSVTGLSKICFFSGKEPNNHASRITSIMYHVRRALNENGQTYIRYGKTIYKMEVSPEIKAYLAKLQFLGINL